MKMIYPNSTTLSKRTCTLINWTPTAFPTFTTSWPDRTWGLDLTSSFRANSSYSKYSCAGRPGSSVRNSSTKSRILCYKLKKVDSKKNNWLCFKNKLCNCSMTKKVLSNNWFLLFSSILWKSTTEEGRVNQAK